VAGSVPAPAPGAAPDPRRARLAEVERERMVARLNDAYAEGRLDLDELRRRVDVVFAAETVADAADVLGDLWTPPSPQPPGRGRRRHAQAGQPGVGWVPTEERFRDPSSGTIMRVWVDPADRSRHYVPDERP
jgi:Domain of unknown function (DUF1707)